MHTHQTRHDGNDSEGSNNACYSTTNDGELREVRLAAKPESNACQSMLFPDYLAEIPPHIFEQYHGRIPAGTTGDRTAWVSSSSGLIKAWNGHMVLGVAW